jgi:glutamate synthase (NADPH/NADH) large chain
VRHDPERGLDETGIKDRIAKGAKVAVRPVGGADREALRALLVPYALALSRSGQDDAATEAIALLDAPDAFRVLRPAGEVVDQSVSTE